MKKMESFYKLYLKRLREIAEEKNIEFSDVLCAVMKKEHMTLIHDINVPSIKYEQALIEEYRVVFYEWLGNVLLKLLDNFKELFDVEIENEVERRVSQKATKAATHAANMKHSQIGGSRDKQNKIRQIWASGKYTNRDRCAEEECAGLNMSFSTARKALRNTPVPT